MDLSSFGTKIAPKLSFLFIFCPSNDMVQSQSDLATRQPQVTSSYLDLLSQSSQTKITKSFLFYIFLAFINIVIRAQQVGVCQYQADSFIIIYSWVCLDVLRIQGILDVGVYPKQRVYLKYWVVSDILGYLIPEPGLVSEKCRVSGTHWSLIVF